MIRYGVYSFFFFVVDSPTFPRRNPATYFFFFSVSYYWKRGPLNQMDFFLSIILFRYCGCDNLLFITRLQFLLYTWYFDWYHQIFRQTGSSIFSRLIFRRAKSNPAALRSREYHLPKGRWITPPRSTVYVNSPNSQYYFIMRGSPLLSEKTSLMLPACWRCGRGRGEQQQSSSGQKWCAMRIDYVDIFYASLYSQLGNRWQINSTQRVFRWNSKIICVW